MVPDAEDRRNLEVVCLSVVGSLRTQRKGTKTLLSLTQVMESPGMWLPSYSKGSWSVRDQVFVLGPPRMWILGTGVYILHFNHCTVRAVLCVLSLSTLSPITQEKIQGAKIQLQLQ